MLDIHYRSLTSREEAERFYAMRPADSDGNSTAIGRGYLCKWRAQQELNLPTKFFCAKWGFVRAEWSMVFRQLAQMVWRSRLARVCPWVAV